MAANNNKKVVRVHFLDDSVRAFAIDEDNSADQLRAIVVERIELKEDSSFALFEKKDGWERCLESNEKPIELMNLWPPKPQGQTEDDTVGFVFKKKIFLREDDKEMNDPVAKHLIYIQALHSVITSEFPCSVEEAIKLAALQVQIVYGDHRPGSHVPGFLTQNLKQFIPRDLFPTKKPLEWENLIFNQHKEYVGKSAEDAKSDYLAVVKAWPFYGTTFYPPCKSIGHKKLPPKTVIGVNAEGILLMNKKDKEIISTHPFTEICSWASSSTTFAFEFGSQTESTKYTFETRQGAIIASTIQTYIDILVHLLKSSEDDEQDFPEPTSNVVFRKLW